MTRPPTELKPADNVYTALLAAAIVVQLGAGVLLFVKYYQLYGQQIFGGK
jgi:hypothetical protein